MQKNLADLKSRLRDVAQVNGVDLPGHTMALQDFHLVSIARGALRAGGERWANHCLPKGLALLKEARASAELDLSTLGYEPTSAKVEGYLDQFSRWPWPEPWPDALAQAAEAAEAAAPPEVLDLLQRRSQFGAQGRKRASTDASDVYRIWGREVLLIVRARILHERALAARETYFCLSKAKTLPSRSVYRERLDEGLSALTKRARKVGTTTVDRLIGASAAAASRWRLDCVRWQLEVADMELLPLGSYFSPNHEPKLLRIFPVIDCRFRALLRGVQSDLAVGRIVAASLMVYAGPRLFPPRSLVRGAREAVDKWRRRLPSELAGETQGQFLLDQAVFKSSKDAEGRTVWRWMSEEPNPRVLWEMTIGVLPRELTT